MTAAAIIDWKVRALAAEARLAEAVEAERERCAKIAEALPTLHCWLPVDNGQDPNHHVTKHGIEIAAAIRAPAKGA